MTQLGTPTGWARDDHGAGTVIGVGIAAALLCCVAVFAPVVSASVMRHRGATVADAAALAAASAAAGLVMGDPCERAAQVASAGGVSLALCDVDGLVVTVAVSVPILGAELSVYATAGPPPEFPYGRGPPEQSSPPRFRR